MRRLSLHIQHNLIPERLQVVLHAAASGSGDIVHVASECRLSVSVLERVVLPFVRQSGLLDANGLSLTELGSRLHRLSMQSSIMFAEGMHQLLYTLHYFDTTKYFSWAYARIVDALWTSGKRMIDGWTMAQLVGAVVEDAAQTFGVPVEKIAFSRDSVRGVLNWLRALDPPTIIRNGKIDVFQRRYFCPELAFLWAVDFLYRVSNTTYGVRMFLSPERAEILCRVCVLDPSGLENVLMSAKRTSDFDRGGVFDYGTEGGFGRWILLARPHPVPSVFEGVR